MKGMFVAMVLLVSCRQSSPSPPVTAPPLQDDGGAAAAGGTGAPASADAAAGGEGSGSATGTCAADAEHCCNPDGTIVSATCSPVVRKPSDAIARGKDGRCEPCMLRCLPPTARIRTPEGEVAVGQLKRDALVMTLDERGRAVPARVIRVSSIPVTGIHEIVVVELADGRTLRASPGHPTLTKTIGDLVLGDVLDGSTVTKLRRERFTGGATWDLLPEGPTGAYWADGVLIESTIHQD
jgi:hypothetical protein